MWRFVSFLVLLAWHLVVLARIRKTVSAPPPVIDLSTQVNDDFSVSRASLLQASHGRPSEHGHGAGHAHATTSDASSAVLAGPLSEILNTGETISLALGQALLEACRVAKKRKQDDETAGTPSSPPSTTSPDVTPVLKDVSQLSRKIQDETKQAADENKSDPCAEIASGVERARGTTNLRIAEWEGDTHEVRATKVAAVEESFQSALKSIAEVGPVSASEVRTRFLNYAKDSLDGLFPDVGVVYENYVDEHMMMLLREHKNAKSAPGEREEHEGKKDHHLVAAGRASTSTFFSLRRTTWVKLLLMVLILSLTVVLQYVHNNIHHEHAGGHEHHHRTSRLSDVSSIGGEAMRRTTKEMSTLLLLSASDEITSEADEADNALTRGTRTSTGAPDKKAGRWTRSQEKYVERHFSYSRPVSLSATSDIADVEVARTSRSSNNNMRHNRRHTSGAERRTSLETIAELDIDATMGGSLGNRTVSAEGEAEPQPDVKESDGRRSNVGPLAVLMRSSFQVNALRRNRILSGTRAVPTRL
ncbi:unnamed protein product [Amoebophrya sp. A25]|nr:unnamed protein product [Amoebophrya sp. A25]|eukprot:GSA25T00000946001.1